MGRIGFKCNFYQVSKVFIMSVSFMLCCELNAVELIDRIVADVNGHPITYSEVQSKVRKGVSVEISAYPLEGSQDPYVLALHDRINLELILQRAEELELSISDEELESEIEKFVQRRKLTKAGLKQALSQEGLTYEQYKNDWRKQMIISQFQGREILPSIKISDKDLEAYYLQNEGNLGESIRVHLRQIRIKGSSEKLVNKVYNELQAGLSFEKGVMLYSDDLSSKKNGGLMPELLLKDLASVFQEPISKLEIRQFTSPIQVSGNTYFFYLENKQFAENDDFLKAKAQIKQRLRQEQIVNKTLNWIKSERRRSDVRLVE